MINQHEIRDRIQQCSLIADEDTIGVILEILLQLNDSIAELAVAQSRHAGALIAALKESKP